MNLIRTWYHNNYSHNALLHKCCSRGYFKCITTALVLLHHVWLYVNINSRNENTLQYHYGQYLDTYHPGRTKKRYWIMRSFSWLREIGKNEPDHCPTRTYSVAHARQRLHTGHSLKYHRYLPFLYLLRIFICTVYVCMSAKYPPRQMQMFANASETSLLHFQMSAATPFAADEANMNSVLFINLT